LQIMLPALAQQTPFLFIIILLLFEQSADHVQRSPAGH
jgi:hypothetical protein